MKNKKGQALVEFVLILPILLLIVFAMIDIGRILLCKTHLENVMNDVVVLVNDDKSSSEIKAYLSLDDYDISYNIEKSQYKLITLKSKVKIITPGLNSFLDNPYYVTVERKIINE